MKAILKDGSALIVSSEERIYALQLPKTSIPLVIDHAEGESKLIEYTEDLQKKTDSLEKSLKRILELQGKWDSAFEIAKIRDELKKYGYL